MEPFPPTTRTAAATIADDTDPDAVRAATLAMLDDAAAYLRELAGLATYAADQGDEAARLITDGEDAAEALRVAAVVTGGILVAAREARQCLTLAVEGDDRVGGRRCACGEPMSDGDPRDGCLRCELAPFGPEWEREHAIGFGGVWA